MIEADMSPRRGRPTQEEALLLADRLADTAFELFVEKGYSGLTIEALAREARVNKRTIYSRFGSKEGLFEAALTRAFDRWSAPIKAELSTAPDQWILKSVEQMLRLSGHPENLALTRFRHGEGANLPFVRELMKRRYRQSIENVMQMALKDHSITLRGDQLTIACRSFIDLLVGHLSAAQFEMSPDQDVGSYVAEWAPRLAQSCAKLFR